MNQQPFPVNGLRIPPGTKSAKQQAEEREFQRTHETPWHTSSERRAWLQDKNGH